MTDRHPAGVAVMFPLGGARRPSTRGGRRVEHDLSRQQCVGLDDDTETSAPLLVPDTFGQAQLVDRFVIHETPPEWPRTLRR